MRQILFPFCIVFLMSGAFADIGVTAHVTWHEFETRGKAFAMMQAAGMDESEGTF